MPPIDPNKPPQDPNQPFKPEVKKLRFEDIFDSEQIRREMNEIFQVSKIVESDEKRSADIHLKYLKIVQTVERFKHTQLVNEKKEILKLLEQEMKYQKGLATVGMPVGSPERMAAGKRVEAEYAGKQQKVETTYKPQLAAAGLQAIVSETIPGGAKLVESFGKLSSSMGIVSIAVSALIKGFLGMSELMVANIRLQAQLRAAGVGLKESGRGVEAATSLFNRLGRDMEVLGVSSDEIRSYISILAKAPDALKSVETDKGTDKLYKFRNAMGYFGVSIEETMKLIGDASREQRLSTDDLTDSFKAASKVSLETGMTFNDAFNQMINMNQELRSLTFNTDEARKMFIATAIPLRKLGFSPVEIQKFTMNLAQAVGGMTVENLIGMLAFTKKRMPTFDELKDVMKGTTSGAQVLFESFLEVTKGMNLLSLEGIVSVKKFSEQAGLTSVTSSNKVLEAWTEMLDKARKAGITKFEDIWKGWTDKRKKDDPVKTFEEIEREGFEALKGMKPPLDKLKIAFETFGNKFGQDFLPAFITFAGQFDKFISFITFQGAKEAARFAGNQPVAASLSAANFFLQQQFGIQLPANLRPNVRDTGAAGHGLATVR